MNVKVCSICNRMFTLAYLLHKKITECDNCGGTFYDKILKDKPILGASVSSDGVAVSTPPPREFMIHLDLTIIDQGNPVLTYSGNLSPLKAKQLLIFFSTLIQPLGLPPDLDASKASSVSEAASSEPRTETDVA